MKKSHIIPLTGWYLSPGEHNDFYKRNLELDEENHSDWQECGFTVRNEKTIGLMVVSMYRIYSINF